MKSIVTFFTRIPKLVIITFTLLFIGALFLIPKVGINDNDADYLPNSSEAKQGIVIFEDEFPDNASKKRAKVLIKDKSINEVIEIKSQIAAIDGVLSVIWLDDFVDLSLVPIEHIPEELKRNYLHENDSLMDITFTEETDSEVSKEAITVINNLLADDGGVGFTPRSAVEVGNVATIVAIIIIVIIIIMFTDSFISSVFVLVTLGVAIAFNFGTNIVFGKISDISFMAAAVIQLAVSIDYCLIFLKNLKIAREKYDNINDSITYATKNSFKTIFAGATTTIAGFLALSVMGYQIGAELGLVLAKGVLLSLIAVIILLPALMKVGIKLVDKTKHKSLLPSINWLGKIINGKVSIFMFLLLIGLSVFGFLGQLNNTFTYSDNQVDYTDIENEMVESFGENNTFILLVPKGNKTNELGLINEINQLENVKSVANLYTVAGVETPDEYIPLELKQQFLSENYSLITIVMDLPIEGDTTFDTVKNVRSLANNFYDESYLTGESAVIYDIKTEIDQDYLLVILISIIAIALIIMLSFKSIVIPIILLLLIQSAIWINMSIPYYQGVSLAFLGYILVSSIQLGATIDYAIIMTEHYQKERKEHNPVEAARLAFAHSAQSIMISMIALAIAGFSLTVIMDMDLIKELGILIGRGTIISGILSLVILPQLLVLFDKLIGKTTLRRNKN